MKKLAGGLATFGLLASSAFAQDYYCNWGDSLDEGNCWALDGAGDNTIERCIEDGNGIYDTWVYDENVGDGGVCSGSPVDPSTIAGGGGGSSGDPIIGYYIFAFDIENTETVSIWGTDVIAYTYNGATVQNAANPYATDGAPKALDEGVLKLKGVNIPGTGYPGAFVAIKSLSSGDPSMLDCTEGFSYWFKGDAHWFNLDFPGTVCGGTAAGDGSNKWGIKVTPGSASEWTRKDVSLSQFSLTNTWDGANCTSTNAASVQLGQISQMTWGFDNNQTGTNLMVGNVACLTSSGSEIASVSPSNSITINTGSISESPSSSSSGGTTTNPSSSSGGGTTTNPSSSSTPGSTPSSSSNNDINPIILLPQVAYSNALNAMNNGINLSATNGVVVKVFDIKGNAVRTYNFASGSYNVSFSDLPRGLYIIKASSASWNKTITVPVK